MILRKRDGKSQPTGQSTVLITGHNPFFFIMSKKRIIVLGFGILLTGLFVYFSLHPHNPGELPTVHMFAYNCLLKTDTFLDGYNYRSEESATEACYLNLRMSLIVIGYGVVGIPLILYSLKNRR